MDEHPRAGPEPDALGGRRAWAALVLVLAVITVALAVGAARDDDEGGIGGRAVPPPTARTAPAAVP